MITTNNIFSGSAPQPSYELRFNPQHFVEDKNSSGKTIGIQEVWKELTDGWFLVAHVVRDDDGVHVRKAFARRGLQADGTFEQHVSVGTYDVVAVADSTAEKSSAPKLDTDETGAAAKVTVDNYLTSQYGWAAKKRG
jgi:hypothetical protein